MANFGIGEIARRAGIATSTIRYYERIGLLPTSERISGKRRYDASILGKLQIIRLAQESGFSLAEIDTLLHDFPDTTTPAERWQAFASRKIAEQDAIIQQAKIRKAFLRQAQNCGCATLEQCAAGLTPNL